jgi:hypothetical protein
MEDESSKGREIGGYFKLYKNIQLGPYTFFSTPCFLKFQF